MNQFLTVKPSVQMVSKPLNHSETASEIWTTFAAILKKIKVAVTQVTKNLALAAMNTTKSITKKPNVEKKVAKLKIVTKTMTQES